VFQTMSDFFQPRGLDHSPASLVYSDHHPAFIYTPPRIRTLGK